MKLTNKIRQLAQKHAGKIILTGLVASFASVVAIGESQKIGCHRPERLMDGMTSYCAYQKGDSTVLYPPFIKGMAHGGIWDYESDGTVDAVGTLGYPRMPYLIIQSESLSERQLEQNQNRYDTVMASIRNSNE
ncbi:hypothetical protein HOC80_02000 [archaeon]|jgi:hypothetical protein|nr:hypothetical protein [archaeon]MBT4416855.1 hypothetical protein [archaeon]